MYFLLAPLFGVFKHERFLSFIASRQYMDVSTDQSLAPKRVQDKLAISGARKPLTPNIQCALLSAVCAEQRLSLDIIKGAIPIRADDPAKLCNFLMQLSRLD